MKFISKYLLFLNPEEIVSEKFLHAMFNQVKISPTNSIISRGQVGINGAEDGTHGAIHYPPSLKGWTRALAGLLKFKNSPLNNKPVAVPKSKLKKEYGSFFWF
jgi:hypothetical protein